MTDAVFFIIGMLLMYLMLQKPLHFHITHTYRNLDKDNDVLTTKDLRTVEQEMFKENSIEDEQYDKLTEVIAEVNDVMGGSDRDGRI